LAIYITPRGCGGCELRRTKGNWELRTGRLLFMGLLMPSALASGWSIERAGAE